MALTLALTRTMLSLPYRADTAEDLERAVRVAIRAASLSRHLMASSPKRLHFASLEACLRLQQPTQWIQPSHSMVVVNHKNLGVGGWGWTNDLDKRMHR